MPRLVLGSASPRRAALLRELGVEFATRVSDVPEVPAVGESAAYFARRIAREKGAAVSRQGGDAWILSADTIVVVDGVVLGKPIDAVAARQMLQRLAGRSHEVLTAVTLTAPGGGLAADILVRSTVVFRPLTEAEIDAYIATGEPFDKAGAYGIQGAAAAFVERVSGSYTNIVGLPMDEVRDLLLQHDLLPVAPRHPAPSRSA